MNDKTAATHLIGMNNRRILEANLSVSFDGLDDHEKDVLSFITKEYAFNVLILKFIKYSIQYQFQILLTSEKSALGRHRSEKLLE